MKRRIQTILQNLIAWIFSAIIVIPIIIIALNSFKNVKESNSMSFHLPSVWEFSNYLEVIKRGNLLIGFCNSFSYALLSTILLLVVTLPCAFVLQRRGAKRLYRILYYVLIIGIALPLNNIALMKVMVGLHLMNTRVGIYLLYAAIGLPLSIFIAHGFMSGIPRELDEAAVIDGCNACNLFLNVIVPLLKPVASTLFILNFLNTWNDFTMAIYFLNGSDKMPVTLSVYNFFGQFQKSWNLVCADIMLTALPVLIVYLFAQKYIIQGLTSGAVKG